MLPRPFAQRVRVRDFARVALLCGCMTTVTLVSIAARGQSEPINVVVVLGAGNLDSEQGVVDVSAVESRRASADEDERRKPDPLSIVAYYDKLYLVAAYADFRETVPRIRVTAYGHRDFKRRLFCKYENHTYRAYGMYINYSNSTIAQWRAIYFTCSVPNLRSPIAQITVGNERDSADDLTMPLHGGEPPSSPRQFLGVCVKSAYGSPDASRIVEWMELNSLLGVDHVILYNSSMPADADPTFQHYVDRGYLTVVQDEFRRRLEAHNASFASLFDGFDATFSTGSEPHPQMQLLSLQDCFHRFRHDYEYILVMDLDEILVPTAKRTLPELLRDLSRRHPEAGAFSFMAAEYLEEFGRASDGGDGGRLHTLGYTRHSQPTYEQLKTVHRTRDTVAVNWHRRLLPESGFVAVSGRSAWLHHYRMRCKGTACRSRRWYDDGPARVGRYAADLQVAVARSLTALGIA